MTDGTIAVLPSILHSGSSAASQHSGTTDDLLNSLMNDFNAFLNVLSPLAGEPVVGPGATALMGALDQSGLGLANALGCFGSGLKILAPAMSREANSFQALDRSLSSTFEELHHLLPGVENYATSVKLIAPTKTQVTALKQYLTSSKQGKPLQIQTTSVPITVQAPHKGGFTGWLADHKWAGWTAVGVITVLGVAGSVFGPESDIGAAAADTAIVGAMDAADATAVTADAVTTTAAATDVTLTTVGNTTLFTEAEDAAFSSATEETVGAIYQYLDSLVPAGG